MSLSTFIGKSGGRKMAQKVKVLASILRHTSHKLSSHLCHHTHAHVCDPHPPTIFKVLNEKKRK